MIEITEAFQIIESEVSALGFETVPVGESVGRILAEDVVADTDLPPFDRSQMDGFAVRSDDIGNVPVDLKIVGESAAGSGWTGRLKNGQAVRIMTGAPVPSGADTVQKVEATSEHNFKKAVGGSNVSPPTNVTVFECAEAGKNIVPRGVEIKKGEVVFRHGELIRPHMIAGLAAFGFLRVNVFKRPRVAVLATGSEIVPIDVVPDKDQIRNSNSMMLGVLLGGCGAATKLLPTVGDDLGALKIAIKNACRRNNIVVITGGVSVGKYDLTKAALAGLGARIMIEKVSLRPGKPMVFARLADTLIFGLPGNPVSASVTFYLFVRLAVMLMQNANEPHLRQSTAIVESSVKAAAERHTFLPARLETRSDGRQYVKPSKWHGSSDFIGFAETDCLISLAAGKSIKAMETVEVVLL